MQKKQQIIEVVPYDANWPAQFEDELKRIEPIFSDNFVKLHHIGSTSIPNLAAKPTIDMLLEVTNIEHVDQCNATMAELGYEAWGEYGIPGRRFFVKGEDKRTHHLHVFQVGSPDIQRHLDFRDYLIAHPEEAEQYAALKIELARLHAHNRRQYVLSKQGFVKQLEAKALDWTNHTKR